MTSPEVERRPLTDKVGVPQAGPSCPETTVGGKRVTFGGMHAQPPSLARNVHSVHSHPGGRHYNRRPGSNPNSEEAAGSQKPNDGSGLMKRPMGHPRQMRKRSYSCSEGHSKPNPGASSNKRWKNANKHNPGAKRNHKNVLPSKFLLGGNIRDPLNLNSLSDERMSKIMNAITPESSPLPTPKHRKPEYKIEVLIPPNISDPLNLNAGVDENEYESKLISPAVTGSSEKKRKKFRYRKRARSTSSKASLMALAREHESEPEHDVETSLDARDEEDVVIPGPGESVTPVAPDSAPTEGPQEPPPPETQPKPHHPIVSPVKRQFKGSKNNFQNAKNSQKSAETRGPPEKRPPTAFHAKNKKFEYGNYSRYYGYRTQNGVEDPRLRHLKPEWFLGQEILDIGCNVGQLTVSMAKLLHPKSIIGMDIDKSLVETARRRLRHTSSHASTTDPARDREGETVKYPTNLPLIFGPLDPTSGLKVPPEPNLEQFPRNVKFVCGNYVLENDELLETVQPEFDVVTCFSTTKWMHMNFGDEGLKRAFKRIFAQLRPGGLFILEAQGFASYRQKKKLTERIYENFQKIKLRPEQFSDYLIHQVGFCSGHTIAVPHHTSRGFQRPLQVFVKRASSSYHASTCSQTTPYFAPSPLMPSKRCYAPSLTPMYNKYTPLYSPSANFSGKTPSRTPSAGATPQLGPSATPNGSDDGSDATPNGSNGKFPKPANPPLYMGGFTPHYSPGNTPTYSGYHQGLTPGYSGPSPEGNRAERRPAQHSPVYTGPPPGLVSNASTPGHGADPSDDFLEPGYAPSHSRYTPSNPGTPSHAAGPSGYSPGPYSPGNATPKGGYRTPGNASNGATAARSATSPQIQQPEISGNTTPHPGPSGNSPTEHQKYLWYGYSSSGGNTPQSNYDPSASPQVYPTHYPPIGNSDETYSNPATPKSPAAGPNSPVPGPTPASPHPGPQSPAPGPVGPSQSPVNAPSPSPRLGTESPS
eukprot:maker-scaffold38_size502422-snap-gene-1.12 protein:Tk05860 transcript:maker-scaffold38_size502422-snap-gene-1.12-mRNA-1 annotation:"7sk snrna methylphosphate capping enzyme"